MDKNDEREIIKRMEANRAAANEATDKLHARLSAASRRSAFEGLDQYMKDSGRVAVAFDEALMGTDKDGLPILYLKSENFGDFVVLDASLVRVSAGDPI